MIYKRIIELDEIDNKKRNTYLIYESIGFKDGNKDKLYEICCNKHSKTQNLKFIPYIGVAYPLSNIQVNNKGQVFNFLPLPIYSNTSFLINGYFELSSNRRDIWYGFDLTGDGALRSIYNETLIKHLTAPSIIYILNECKKYLDINNLYKLFPINNKLDNNIWSMLNSEIYKLLYNEKLIQTDNKIWLEIKNCIILQQDITILKDILFKLDKNISNSIVSSLPLNIIEKFQVEGYKLKIVNISFIRQLIKMPINLY